MPDLSISLLGPFEATLDKRPLTPFRTKSVQALLIYLVCEAGRPHQREALMALLWPGMPLTSAQANMRQTLYRLRKLVPEVKGKSGETAVPFLISNRQTIQINPDADYFSDIQRFSTYVDSEPEQAITLYRDDFLVNFYLPESEPFENWAAARREAYRRQMLLALEGATAVHIQQANYDQAIQLAQHQLSIDNLRESSHRQLMEAWARNGRRQQALTHYNALTQLLQNELAIDPEPETLALVEAIRSGEIDGDSHQTTEPVNQPAPPQHNLPQRLTSFVGRQKEITTITDLIDQNRLIMLTGVGGIGKTNLCLEVGRLIFKTFPDGVWLVELAPITDPALVPQTAAHTLGVRVTSDRPVFEVLLEFLSKKSCLLILDNCEHVIDSAAHFVETVLQACPHIKILASSREALAVPGEIPYRVPPLSIPNVHQPSLITDWGKYDAVRLFVERATTVLPDFQITSANFNALVQICQRLDGIPLAIELAAARVSVLTTEQIAARLDDRFRLLTGGSRTALPRQQTLRALIDWSWDLLTKREQLLLQRLSVFAGGMSLEAVEAICADELLDVYDLLDLLSELVNKSLISVNRKSGQETRYQMLETIRQYAQERLANSGLGATFRERHLVYFRQMAEEAEQALAGPDQANWLNRLETDLDNVRAALSWAREIDIETGLKVATSLWRFWENGYVREGEGWLTQFLGSSTLITISAKAKAIWVQGRFNVDLANLERAYALAEESLALYQELEDQHGIVLTLMLKSYSSPVLDSRKRQASLQECLTLFRSLGDKLWVADILNWMGFFESELNNYEQAKIYLQESESIFRELGHLAGLAMVLNSFTETALWEGDYASAKTMVKESLAIQESLGPRRSSISLQLLGRLHFRLGNYQQASTYLEKSLSMLLQSGEKLQSYWVSARLGFLYLRMGELAKAQATFDACQRHFKEAGIIIGVVYALEGLASLAAVQKQAEKAVRLFAWADATREMLENPRPPAAQTAAEHDMALIIEMMNKEWVAATKTAGEEMTMEQAIANALSTDKG